MSRVRREIYELAGRAERRRRGRERLHMHSASTGTCAVAVLQFRGASSAVIFIPQPVIRGEATRRHSKKCLERRYGNGIF